jgi:hypothetical protein
MNVILFEAVQYTSVQELLVICRVAEQKLCFEMHSLKQQLDDGARTTKAISGSWK